MPVSNPQTAPRDRYFVGRFAGMWAVVKFNGDTSYQWQTGDGTRLNGLTGWAPLPGE